jgi:hypothetical protein
MEHAERRVGRNLGNRAGSSGMLLEVSVAGHPWPAATRDRLQGRKVRMARESMDVTFVAEDGSRIPDNLTEGAALLLDLVRRGAVAAVGDRVHIRRQGGFCGLDVWLALFLFFTTGATSGFKSFWDTARPHSRSLAALAGRRSLASPPAVSRALDAVEPELLRPIGSWLLRGLADVDEVLRHPSVQTYDTLGRGWHGFHVDPTVQALRHRALPVGDDLPEVLRRSMDTGKPGYKGRKRGDIVFRRATAQHAGSGLWVHAHLSEGNGDSVADFELTLDSVAETCDRIGHPREQSFVVMDGEHGNVPWYAACRARRLPFITRLNRPNLYEDPDVLARLGNATWYEVPDSRCGPQRAAADLGMLTLPAGKQTRRRNGSEYEPITVRIVACIFPKSGDAKRGRTVDGWEVELFAVDLPADAWPAPEAICAYYGRNALENRFAQEDRELGLDRIVSYHLPGQELATLVGLSLWNLRLVRGFQMATPPAEQPVQHLRQPKVDERVPEQWPRDPVVVRALGELDWPTLLASRDGWSYDAATGELLCEDGRVLTLTTVRKSPRARATTSVIFRRPWGGCEQCPVREGCLHTEREGSPKHVEFAIPTDIADRLRTRLKRVRGKGDAPPTRVRPVVGEPGPRAVRDPLFLPALARQDFRALVRGATLHVEVEIPPQKRGPRLVAVDQGDRQRRRKTWDQNLARHALPDDARVSLRVAAGADLRRMLGDTDRPEVAVGGSG